MEFCLTDLQKKLFYCEKHLFVGRLQTSVPIGKICLQWSLPFVNRNELLSFEEKETNFYSFHSKLLPLGLIIQALTQILAAFMEYFYGMDKQSFVLDKDYKLLRMLAWHMKPTEMITSYIILQKRCSLAVNHVKRDLNKLKQLFTDKSDIFSISSYNSTMPSEHSQITDLSPQSTLTTYLTREDYASGLQAKMRYLEPTFLTNWILPVSYSSLILSSTANTYHLPCINLPKPKWNN